VFSVVFPCLLWFLLSIGENLCQSVDKNPQITQISADFFCGICGSTTQTEILCALCVPCVRTNHTEGTENTEEKILCFLWDSVLSVVPKSVKICANRWIKIHRLHRLAQIERRKHRRHGEGPEGTEMRKSVFSVGFCAFCGSQIGENLCQSVDFFLRNLCGFFLDRLNGHLTSNY